MDAVVEHFTDPVASLRDIARYLAPGGRLVLTTPNMDSGSYRFLKGRWTSMLCPHGHVFLYGHRGIAGLIQAAGLELERTGSYHYPLYTPLDYLKRLGRGDLKGAAWRAHQDLGLVYDRLLGEGSVLFAVARRPAKSAN
jgi:SAM-dependent methyltransferase